MSSEKEKNITVENTAELKAKNTFKKIWSDSVFSQLIATGIIFLLPFFSAIIYKLLEGKSIKEFFKDIFHFEIKLYVLLILSLILVLGYFLYLRFYKKKNEYQKHFLSQKIGNYRYGDLNNILLTTYAEIPLNLHYRIGLKELDLLTLFKLFMPQFSYGVGWNDPTEYGDFLYYQLGPDLIAYQLCEKRPSLDNNTAGNINSFDIVTSANGFKFFALLESIDRLDNRDSYEKEFEENQKKKNEISESKKASAQQRTEVKNNLFLH
ncbi:MAG: hypothetical protein ACSHW7_11615 [Patiriisocius sp.]|uniref:hypothetical protein n=1 Tax=Patiriisocius sp. TaxID=2822396 RepID=UPI003EF1DFC8